MPFQPYHDPITITFFHISLYFLTIFFVIFLLFSVNTIYSLMSLAGIIFCTFLFLLVAKQEFFALIYLLIYIGAIIVFFLFSIMLLHLKFERIFDFEISHATATLTFVLLNFMIWNLIIEMRNFLMGSSESFVIYSMKFLFDVYCNKDMCIPGTLLKATQSFHNGEHFHSTYKANNIETIGIVLFDKHGFLCFIVGFILLITMFGSMQLLQYSKRLHKATPNEDEFEDTIVL